MDTGATVSPNSAQESRATRVALFLSVATVIFYVAAVVMGLRSSDTWALTLVVLGGSVDIFEAVAAPTSHRIPLILTALVNGIGAGLIVLGLLRDENLLAPIGILLCLGAAFTGFLRERSK